MPLHPQAQKIARYVQYEVDMCIATAAALNGGRMRGGALENALIESFLIHARVLCDFFFFPSKRKDDVLAKHFFHSDDQWQPDYKKECPYLEANSDRLNKAVAHLSYARIGYEIDKRWQHNTINGELLAVWDRFKQSLPPESQKFFYSMKEKGTTVLPSQF